MKNFDNLMAFSEHLVEVAIAQHVMQDKILGRAAKLVQKTAKDKIGEYQPQAGPFIEWAELAESTKAYRLRKGYAEDDPLMRDGTLRDSIEYQVQDGEAAIGSNLDIAVYQELGTQNIPPRSFLASSMVEKLPEIESIIGQGVTAALVGEDVFNGRIAIEG